MASSTPTSHSLVQSLVECNLKKCGLPVPSMIASSDALLHQQPCTKLLQSVHELCEEVVISHAAIFRQIFEHLPMSPDRLQSNVESIMSDMFSDRVYNWGRITTLLAFCMKVTEECVQKEMPQLVPKVIEWTGSFIDAEIRTWLDENDGWVGMIECCQPSKKASEPFSWKSVCSFAAGAVGFITLAAIAASRG